MNRKMNPWVSRIALMLLVVILVTTCTGCATEPEEELYERGRFNVESSQITRAGTLYVLTDTETEAQYLFIKSGYGYGGGLTKLEE